MNNHRRLSILLIIFAATFSIFTTTISVSASKGDYYISNIVIDAFVDGNGDMIVEERYEYVFNGSFNGIRRNIKTKGSSGVTDFEVNVVDNNSVKVEDFEVNTSKDAVEVKIYSKSTNESKTFSIKYKVNNIITKYSDMSELKWLFYENEADVKTDNITVYLTLPKGMSDSVTFRGEGPKRGLTTTESNYIKLELNNMKKNEVIGAQVLFPADWTNTENYINMKRDEFIRQNKHRDNITTAKSLAVVASVLALIGALARRRKKKSVKAVEEYRSTYMFYNKGSYDQLPSSLTPAMVSKIIHNKTDINDLLATVLYLANKDIIKFSNDAIQRKDYHAISFKIVNAFEGELMQSERHLLSWLSKYSTDDVISLDTLLEKASISEFYTNYNEWIDLLEGEAESLNLYTNIGGKKILRNEYENERRKWEAFKNYLYYCSAEDIEALKAQGLWESIVPYTIILDNAKDIINDSDIYDDDISHCILMNNWFLNKYCTTYRKELENAYLKNPDISSSSNFSDTGGSDFGGGGGSDAF
jgi:uncharacterized membrane protein